MDVQNQSPEFSLSVLKQNGIKTLSSIKETQVKWLWYPYIPRGKVTILQGDPGGGKTSLAMSILADISRCREIQPCIRPRDPIIASCFYQTAEDGVSDTIVPRLKKYDADLSKIVCMTEDSSSLTFDDGRIESVAFALLPDIIVLDPIQAFLGADVDMHRANEIRPKMAYLAELAEVTETAIVLIGHLNKSANNELYRGLGSIDIAASARSVLMMERDKINSEVRVLRHIKSSLARNGDPLDFVFTPEGRLTFKGIHQDLEKTKEPKALMISYFIRAYLGSEEKSVDDLKKQISEKFGTISSVTWTEAKRLAEVETIKHGKEWFIRVSKDADFTNKE